MSEKHILRPAAAFLMTLTTLAAASVEFGTQLTVRDAYGDNVIWTQVSISSETPFAYDETARTIYAHPNHDGVATFDYGDMATFSDEEWWRFDGAYLKHGGEQIESGTVVSLHGDFEGVMNYAYHSYTGWQSYTMTSRIEAVTPVMALETEGPSGEPVTLFLETIDAVTPYFDYTNVTYHFNLGQGTDQNRMPCANLPVHLKFVYYSGMASNLIYDAGWATTDAEGNVEFGSGGENEEYLQCSGPLDYMMLKVTPLENGGIMYTSYAYLPYEGRIDGDFKFFDGTFQVDVRDPCGNPVLAKVELYGGPLTGNDAIYGYKTTDTNGHVDFTFDDGGQDRFAASVKLLPLIDLSMNLTQVIDEPSGYLTGRPLFVNGTVEFVSGAYSIQSSDKLAGLTLKLKRDGALIKTCSFDVKKTYTVKDKRTGRDRYKFSVPVTTESHRYTIEAYLDDTDGNETLAGSTWRDVQATVKPADDHKLLFQYVPIEPQKNVTNTGWLENYIEQVLPAEVVYSYAPPLKPSLWPWEGDIMRLMGWYRELERYRVSQTPAPDLVIW